MTLTSVFGLEPSFLLLVLVVGWVGFVVSSTFGVGGALLLIPLLAQRMPAAHAVALSAPVMLFNNLLKAIVFRRSIDKRGTLLVSALALPAAFLGALWSTRLDDRWILIGVAALIILSIVIERGLERRVKVSDRGLLLWGAVTGAVSGICGAAGPPTAIGLRGWGLDKEPFVATVALFAILLQVVKIPAYIGGGVLPLERWPLALLLSVTAALGVAVAPRLLRTVPTRVFALALDGILAVSAAVILLDVLRR